MIHSQTTDDGRELQIRITGRFDFSSHQAFRQSYKDTDLDKLRITIDLSGTNYIDSAALGMLLVLRERTGGEGSRIVLKGCTADVGKILQISQFGKLFTFEY